MQRNFAKNNPAYILEWEHWEGKSHDIVCRIVEFPGWESNRHLIKVWPPVRPPERVEFDTNFELLEEVPDYPNNTADWPLMSRRMLDVLLSVREFAYHEIPVTLVQDTIPVEVRYDACGRPYPEYFKTDYVAVQLADHADVFDAERSLFTGFPWEPKDVVTIEKLVMSIPPEGLPPLFRMSACQVPLFVSEEARGALERAGIRGPVFRPASAFPW